MNDSTKKLVNEMLTDISDDDSEDFQITGMMKRADQ